MQPMDASWTVLLWVTGGLAGLWLVSELLVRWTLGRRLPADFYGSISRDAARQRQAEHGIRVATGPGWVHLGWIADPDRERYCVEKRVGSQWHPHGRAHLGSYLIRDGGGVFRVRALARRADDSRILGEVRVEPGAGDAPVFTPRIAGPWRPLFRPQKHGYYVNDHTLYPDRRGDWRLVGITHRSEGSFNEEKYFAVGVSKEFPPSGEMREAEPVADFGELAWAPHVIRHEETYHMFWSPHRLHQMSSRDGITWEDHRITLRAPYHKFFRDPMVFQVADGQWLLYTTARGRYYSRVDLYQSFDLKEWQYIRSALRTGWGSERNSPFASTESPTVVHYRGRYYLASTYNNDSFFWPGLLLLLRRWPKRASYNDTLVFHSGDPYDFGVYRGAAGPG
jgi:hypothetical protein